MDVQRYLRRTVSNEEPPAVAAVADTPVFSLEPIALVVNLAWIVDAVYLIARLAAFVIYPFFLLIYFARIDASFHGLVWDRWNRRLFEEALYWIEPLVRLVLIGFGVRAASHIAGQRRVPQVDLWAYILLRLVLMGVVLGVAWPSPSMLPFVGQWSPFLEPGAGMGRADPGQSLLWVTIDMTPPIAVGLALFAMPRGVQTSGSR